ncbi:MAG: RNA methyltransferase [Chloroflexi bacterium]|nr:MAG: RNA methyltransferase [Chloroflexota bacterium]
MPEPITSLSNPLIKQARALRQKKARDESGLFLVEGILHVGEAAEAGWEFESLLYCPERLKSEFARQLVEKLSHNGIRCQPVSAPAFESFAEKENPQGIAALVRQENRQLAEFSPKNMAFGAAVVSPQDPGNIGTILRTLDAVGADGLFLLDGGADPYQPAVVRASMGALFWKPFAQASFGEFIAWVKKNGYRLIGTSARGSLDYRAARLDQRPTILLLGSEQKGLTPQQIAACDDLVALPMRGRATSLNLAVAAGILLYALKA